MLLSGILPTSRIVPGRLRVRIWSED